MLADSLKPIKKVRLAYKAAAFIAAVITLSWFFEGTRQVGQSVNLQSVGILAAGTVLTMFLLAVQAFWMYVEEKSKGTLTKRIKMFDSIEVSLEASSTAKGRREVACRPVVEPFGNNGESEND